MRDWGLVDANRIQAFYDSYFKITGNSLGWETPISAVAIYQEASNSLHQDWGGFGSLLDVGSGEGHFFEYLRAERGFKGAAVGLEILPMFYKAAVERYGMIENTQFILADFLTYDFKDKLFDWVTSLGSLSVEQKYQKAHDWAMCQKMLQLARFGVSIYINDPKNTPVEERSNIPNLAWHDTQEITSMLNDLGALEIQTVDFSVNAVSKGTILHVLV